MKMRLILLVTLTSLALGSNLPAPEGKRSATPGELEYWDWDDGSQALGDDYYYYAYPWGYDDFSGQRSSAQGLFLPFFCKGYCINKNLLF